MNWRDQILQEFTPQVAPFTLVADSDNLLTEAEILQKIQARGFSILPFRDGISFRYIYETQYRDRSENEVIDLVIVLNEEDRELDTLPYDLLKAGRKLTFSLVNLFPNFSYTVVNALERSDFDALYQAQTQHKPQQLGENATKDFILRYVFDIDSNVIKQTSDLLLILLRRHSSGKKIPTIFNERFIQILRERNLCSNLPLETIIPDSQAFFTFLQQNWVNFIKQKLTKSQQVSEAIGNYINSTNLPFDNEEIRLYLNQLFIKGHLQPIVLNELGITTANLQLNPWIRIGLRIDPEAEKLRRLQDLMQFIDSSIPDEDAKYQDWLKFAQTWAELIVLWYEAQLSSLDNQFIALQEKVDNTFFDWIELHYGTLYNQAANTPVMLHQIPRFLERNLEASKTNKVALIVLDGLAFDQWLILRQVLLAQNPNLKLSDEAVFAWIPTITSVSRQTIFAGKPPMYFPNSLNTTAKEESLWKQYWIERGFKIPEIAYIKGLGEADSISVVEEISPLVRVLGLVVDKVDKIMHGMQLGTAGMHNQVRQWAELGFISNLLDLLLNNGFQIFLTSDHGNIEATGIGQPKEGATAELRGERVRVYPNYTLRTNVKNQFPNAIEWQNLGLPPEYLPLLAPSRQAFIRQGEKIVAHGGTSLEELVVPFIGISI
ncbi:BREX-3 system phosphatase PglZ [Rivularia sp. UHCC 0363]|uniref:BREX-3 system phosphatase PglZ n=1 Tax=Rivularia sp. UHCC 0363 TaxID=3110244 RepID=UPI002B2067CF|nr:BREX-3 system phosphatase PglZ [Rivularia sp. UHCC 0363]MEA5598981.1 BREX-3 system phosphatase PglZ [Rivularia sp. UHCC 0363]